MAKWSSVMSCRPLGVCEVKRVKLGSELCAAGGGYVIVTRHTSLKSAGWVRSRYCANTRGCSRQETTHAPSSRRLLNNWSWLMPPRCVGSSSSSAVAAAALSAITLHIGHFTRPTRVLKGGRRSGVGRGKHGGIHYTHRLTVWTNSNQSITNLLTFT